MIKGPIKWILLYENNTTDDHYVDILGVFESPDEAKAALQGDQEWRVTPYCDFDEHFAADKKWHEAEWIIRAIPYNPESVTR